MHRVNEQVNDLKSCADELAKDLHANVTVKKVSRIGLEKDDRTRPLLFETGSEEDKDKLFSNLGQLKGVENHGRSNNRPKKHHQGIVD